MFWCSTLAYYYLIQSINQSFNSSADKDKKFDNSNEQVKNRKGKVMAQWQPPVGLIKITTDNNEHFKNTEKSSLNKLHSTNERLYRYMFAHIHALTMKVHSVNRKIHQNRFWAEIVHFLSLLVTCTFVLAGLGKFSAIQDPVDGLQLDLGA